MSWGRKSEHVTHLPLSVTITHNTQQQTAVAKCHIAWGWLVHTTQRESLQVSSPVEKVSLNLSRLSPLSTVQKCQCFSLCESTLQLHEDMFPWSFTNINILLKLFSSTFPDKHWQACSSAGFVSVAFCFGKSWNGFSPRPQSDYFKYFSKEQ